MPPPVAAPIVGAKRTALVRRPGVPSGQSITIFNCRIPCAIAGAGKLTLAPAANDPAPAKRSRRLTDAPFLRWTGWRACVRLGSRTCDRLNEPAAVQEGALGDVAPIHDRRAELLVARVDFLGQLVAGADLGHAVLDYAATGL